MFKAIAQFFKELITPTCQYEGVLKCTELGTEDAFKRIIGAGGGHFGIPIKLCAKHFAAQK